MKRRKFLKNAALATAGIGLVSLQSKARNNAVAVSKTNVLGTNIENALMLETDEKTNISINAATNSM
jgi:hypothetical protein